MHKWWWVILSSRFQNILFSLWNIKMHSCPVNLFKNYQKALLNCEHKLKWLKWFKSSNALKTSKGSGIWGFKPQLSTYSAYKGMCGQVCTSGQCNVSPFFFVKLLKLYYQYITPPKTPTCCFYSSAFFYGFSSPDTIITYYWAYDSQIDNK